MIGRPISITLNPKHFNFHLHITWLCAHSLWADVWVQWVDQGYYAELSVSDVKDEIFDMVKPKHELEITRQELIECKVAGSIHAPHDRGKIIVFSR